MRKLLLTSLLFSASTSLFAHDVWVDTPATLAENSPLAVALGYGDFPVKEKIAESRLDLFPPLELVADNGDITPLTQQGENYQFVSQQPLSKGSYWITARYNPTFWSKNAEGKWARENLSQMQDVVYCEQTQMFAKSLLVVGDAENKPFIQHPIGQDLEIVPLIAPSLAKAGEPFPVQIFYEGEPLADETVIATADTLIAKDVKASLDHREPQAFSGKTDKKGRVNILPMFEGLWKIKVIHKEPFKESKICQQQASYATLILPVGEMRATISHEGHSH